MPSIIREAGETFITLVKGFSVTFRNMLRKPVTENYPEEPVHFQPRYRGIHVLHRDESGLEKCVGCFLCAAACPARCIYIEAAENTDSQRISAGRTLRSRLQYRLFALYFLRLLRGGLPDRRHYARSWLRAGHVQHQFHDLPQGKAARKSSRRALGFSRFSFCIPQGLLDRRRGCRHSHGIENFPHRSFIEQISLTCNFRHRPPCLHTFLGDFGRCGISDIRI